jgi:hypothetical protein
MTQNCEPFENKIKIIKSYILDVIKYKKYRKIKHNIINISFEECTSSSDKDNDELVIQEKEDDDGQEKDDRQEDNDKLETQDIPKIDSISIYDKDYTHILDLNNKKSLCPIDIFPKTKYKNYIFRYKTKYYLIYELDHTYYYKKISLTKLNKLIKTIILF